MLERQKHKTFNLVQSIRSENGWKQSIRLLTMQMIHSKRSNTAKPGVGQVHTGHLSIDFWALTKAVLQKLPGFGPYASQ